MPEYFSLLSDGNGVRIYEEGLLLHLDVANAVLSIGKCKVRYRVFQKALKDFFCLLRYFDIVLLKHNTLNK